MPESNYFHLIYLQQIPLCHISDSVYKTSADWISQKSTEALGNFVLWCLDSILADLANQQPAGKGSKRPVHQPLSKSQVPFNYIRLYCYK